MGIILWNVYTGRGESDSDIYDDTWALDMSIMEWSVVNITQGVEVPEARFDAAGGVWGNRLWLSMGRTKGKRTLSDTWILNLNASDDGGLVGECVVNFT